MVLEIQNRNEGNFETIACEPLLSATIPILGPPTPGDPVTGTKNGYFGSEDRAII